MDFLLVLIFCISDQRHASYDRLIGICKFSLRKSENMTHCLIVRLVCLYVAFLWACNLSWVFPASGTMTPGNRYQLRGKK